MADEYGPESVRNLEIWQEGMGIVRDLYMTSRAWPEQERFSLTSQVRRAAVSIPSNLAEGVGRSSPRETSRFAQIALGSVYELDTLLQIAVDLGFSDGEMLSRLRQRLWSLARRISSFISYQQQRQRGRR
jgi:four helix bundle protein